MTFDDNCDLIVCKVESVTSWSVTEAVAASGGVGWSTAELVLGPEGEEARTVAGVETATGAFLSKPC